MTPLKGQWGNPCLSDYMHNLPGDNWGLYSNIHSRSSEYFLSSVDGGRVGGSPFTYHCLHTWHSVAAHKQWLDSVRGFTDAFIWILQECLCVGGRSFWEGVLCLLRMFYIKHYGKPPTKDCQCIQQALIYPSRFASCHFWKQHFHFSCFHFVSLRNGQIAFHAPGHGEFMLPHGIILNPFVLVLSPFSVTALSISLGCWKSIFWSKRLIYGCVREIRFEVNVKWN